MTQADQRRWADGLAPTVRGQALIIANLLAHEATDRMTLDDRNICRNQLNRLERILQPSVVQRAARSARLTQARRAS